MTFRYVIDDKQVINITNSKDLLKRDTRRLNNYAILIGNPSFDSLVFGVRYPALPGTQKEVTEISKILENSGWNTELWMLEEANEANLKSSFKPDILHIASHGYFDSDAFEINPLFESGIILSKEPVNPLFGSGDDQDGILTAYEAMNLNLDNSHLVILSACETGQGEYKNGEGVFGLQRALKIAGADNLIMSIWKVDDRVTTDLMIQFYRNWIEGESISDAFQRAQLEIKRQHPDPFYWGGFILIGG